MDNTKKSPTLLSLCTGYGGIEAGIEKAIGPVKILTHVEIEAFADCNLVNKMETWKLVPVPIWTNIKTFRPHIFRDKVDILTGGYPCQPFSAAGKRKGKDDPRHLWPWVRETIKAVRPGLCFFENVEGHVSLGLREVLTDLVKLGYSVENDCGEPTWGLFSASEVGAHHQRKRVFILAHSNQQRPQRWDSGIMQKCSEQLPIRPGGSQLWPARPGQKQYEWEEPRVVGNSTKQRFPDRGESSLQRSEKIKKPERSCSKLADTKQQRSIQPEHPTRSWKGIFKNGSHGQDNTEPDSQTQPQLGRTINGNTDRVDRLRLLGNGVVPATAEKAFITLMNRILNPGPVQPSIQLEIF